jgi:outer membrane protein assembly factor BamB
VPDGILRESSGPRELWTLVNPPLDVVADGKTVFVNPNGSLSTTNGMVQAVDATGKILWQRPAFDGIKGAIGPGQAFGSLTVGNGIVFIGYADALGTMVALDANTGIKRFQFQNTIPVNNVLIPSGSIESGPQVVGRRVYWGTGAETGAYFPARTGIASGRYVNGGNRLYMFLLPPVPDDVNDDMDANTSLDD